MAKAPITYGRNWGLMLIGVNSKFRYNETNKYTRQEDENAIIMETPNNSKPIVTTYAATVRIRLNVQDTSEYAEVVNNNSTEIIIKNHSISVDTILRNFDF